MTKHRIYSISVASVYPHYIAKAEKKGRTKAEVDEIIRWLTGYSQAGAGRSTGRQDQLRGFLRAGAPAEPVAVADHRHDLRHPRRRHRGTPDAGAPLPGQADRRARQGEKDGEDPAEIAGPWYGLRQLPSLLRMSGPAARSSRESDFIDIAFLPARGARGEGWTGRHVPRTWLRSAGHCAPVHHPKGGGGAFRTP